MSEGFAFTLRTPHEVVFDEAVDAVRLNTETGQAGLRPGGESLLSVVEPGLILVRQAETTRFAVSAGGLVEFDGQRCSLYTPFAAVGGERDVLAALERIQTAPDSELVARQQLGELEQRIVRELATRRPVPDVRRPDAKA